MKNLILSLIAMTAITSAFAQNSKTLVVYYSRTGNTEAVARQIQSLTGADLFRVETVKPYPEDYRQTTDVAKEELNNNARPAIKGSVENLSQYDTVFIGFPIWWGTYPMGVATFLENHNLAGKTVIPFCTHEGSRQGQSFTDIRNATPGSVNKAGLAVRGGQAATSKADVEKWLRESGVIE